ARPHLISRSPTPSHPRRHSLAPQRADLLLSSVAADRAIDMRCNGRPTGSSFVSPESPKSAPRARPARGFPAAASSSFSPAVSHPRAFARAPLVVDPPPDSPPLRATLEMLSHRLA